ncbi:MAG TPA: serine hydrolase [Bryobacteraceae bacterium]|nr:serine hydrolase [Bryobacteraceae bacterium]
MPSNKAVLLATFAVLATAQTAVSRLWEDKLQDKVRSLDHSLNGVIGLAAIDLFSGRTIVYNGDIPYPTASTIKIAIMIQLFRDEHAGRVHFDDKVTLNAKENAGGSESPLQTELNKGEVTLTVHDLLENMIVYSDNSATNKLIDVIGMDRVNQLVRSLGLQNTALRRKMMDTEAAANGNENISSPLELATLVRMIYDESAADSAACKAMLELMKKVNNGYMRGALPPGTVIASKPGDLDGVRAEVGLVMLPKRPFIVAVMSTWLDDNVNPVPDATRAVYGYFFKLAHSNEYGRRLD